MGFTCYICFESFDEASPATEKGGGDGHGEAKARTVSALIKCGHAFHTECLKRKFETQSGNAWVAKSCPVCKIVVAIHDVIRIHACAQDARSNQRPRIEEMMMALKKLQEEYDAAGKRFNVLRAQLQDKNLETDAIKRRNDELSLRLDQLGRVNSIHVADIERYKAEIDKLKNIIITLTEKLTGNDVSIQDYYSTTTLGSNGMNGAPGSSNGVNGAPGINNGMSGSSGSNNGMSGAPSINNGMNGTPGNNGMNGTPSNVCRLEYTEELQRVPGCDSSSVMTHSMINGSLQKLSHHHPPGFLNPMSITGENRSDGPDWSQGNRMASASSDAFNSMDNIIGTRQSTGNGKMMVQMHAENQQHQQGRITSFALQDVQVRTYDSNNNNKGSIALNMQMVDMDDFCFTNNNCNDSAPITDSMPASIACGNGNAYLSKGVGTNSNTVCKLNNLFNATAPNESVKKQEGHDGRRDDAGYLEADEGIDKWHEKKSRRRGSSRGSGGTHKGGRSSNRFDTLVDKKLLYGSFLCPTCNAKWGSSQSILNTPQTCRYCRTEVHPYSQGPILSRKQLEQNKQPSVPANATARVTSNKNK